MINSSFEISENNDAQVAIPQQLLAQLITKGLLHGDECRCLNATAKQVLWQALLASSINGN
ncbi:hypothetical protein [Thalassotalea fusca]